MMVREFKSRRPHHVLLDKRWRSCAVSFGANCVSDFVNSKTLFETSQLGGKTLGEIAVIHLLNLIGPARLKVGGRVRLTGQGGLGDITLSWMVLSQILWNWIFLGLLATAVVFALYLVWYDRLGASWKEKVNRERDAIEKLKDCSKKQELPWSGSGRRENSMIVMGSIFVVASFAILAGAATSMSNQQIAIAAPLVYCVWLLAIQLSTRVMNDSDAEMKLIPQGEGGAAGISRRLYGDGHGHTFLTKLRRNHWLAYVPILWFPALYLIMH